MDLIEKKLDSFLVTTALEKTWPEGSPILFLGEWCRLYHRKDRWQSLDNQLLPFHWDDRDKLNFDFDYLQKFNEELLDDLGTILNDIHGTEHNSKYWKILIGFWVNTYTTVLYDRWYSIKEATKQGGLSTIVLPLDSESLAANDTSHFCDLAGSNNYWNHMIYLLCLSDDERLKRVQNNDSECIANFKNSVLRHPPTLTEKVKNFISNGLWLFKRKNRVVIFNSYLSLRDKVVLNASFGQLPSLVDSLGKVEDIEYLAHFRAWRLSGRAGQDSFKKFARQVVPLLMPRIFLEGYKVAQSNSVRSMLPRNPKVIFTSISQYVDDSFKFWTGNQVNNGTKLFIGEHGGFAASRFSGSMSYDFSIADKYLSTGWDSKSEPVVCPVGNFRVPFRKKAFNISPDGPVLVTCGSMTQYVSDIRSMALGPQTIQNYGHVFDLVDLMTQDQKKQLRIRLHPSDQGWDQKARWLERHPSIQFAEASKSIHKSMSSFRLLIVTYRATVYIDSLMANIPTVMFWDPNLWEVSDCAASIFARLCDAGIFHSSPGSAATHIQKHWNNIPGWWDSEEVQEARLAFLSAYSGSHLSALKNIKTEIKRAKQCPST